MYILDEIRDMVEVELVSSFPIYNKNKELVFCYDSEIMSENSMRIKSIRHVFQRERDGNGITDVIHEVKLPHDIERDMQTYTVMVPEFTEELEVLFDSYENCYLEFVTFAYSESLTEEQKENARKLRWILESFLTDNLIKRLYEFFGKEMFQYLETIN